MKTNTLLFVLAVLLTLSGLASCSQDQAEAPLDFELERTLMRLSGGQNLNFYLLPDETDLANIPAGVGNPLTPEKVALGQMLFFETALGIDARDERLKGTFACASCHVPSAAFTPGAPQGIADGAAGFGLNGEGRRMVDYYEEDDIDAQGARPLSMLGTAYVTNSMWAGRFGAFGDNAEVQEVWGVHDPATAINFRGLDGLEAQNIEGTHTHRLNVDDYILDTLGYRNLFDAAFADWPNNARYGREAMSFALSAYIRTVLPNQAPWQEWLRGNHQALTDQQKRGALLFFGEAGCYRCHNGPALNSNTFHAIGVNDLCDIGGLRTGPEDSRNLGRGDFTRRDEDMYAFKVPQLYNLKDMPYYFHGSSMQDLRDVVQYFNAGEPQNRRVPQQYISEYFHPLGLTDLEVNDLVEFLKEALHDPDLERYTPTSVLSGNCMPNHDQQSRQDLGCD